MCNGRTKVEQVQHAVQVPMHARVHHGRLAVLVPLLDEAQQVQPERGGVLAVQRPGTPAAAAGSARACCCCQSGRWVLGNSPRSHE